LCSRTACACLLQAVRCTVAPCAAAPGVPGLSSALLQLLAAPGTAVSHGVHACDTVRPVVQEVLALQCFSSCTPCRSSCRRSALACERMLAAHSLRSPFLAACGCILALTADVSCMCTAGACASLHRHQISAFPCLLLLFCNSASLHWRKSSSLQLLLHPMCECKLALTLGCSTASLPLRYILYLSQGIVLLSWMPVQACTDIRHGMPSSAALLSAIRECKLATHEYRR
jgi:hypothetical protein